MLQAMGIEFGPRPTGGDGAAGAPSPAPDAGPSARRGPDRAPGSAPSPAAAARPSASGDPAPRGAPTDRPGAGPSAAVRGAPPVAGGPAPRGGSPAGPPPDRIERYIGDLATAEARAAAAPADAAGATAAHWLVVGEPMQAGSPPATLLAAMLRSVGLLADGGAPRERAALAMLEPGADPAFDRARLLDAVLRASPRCVLVLGRGPARALLSTEAPLAELRGKVHRLGDVPVVVTYAAAYLVRQPADKARAWDDLCLAVAACEAGR